MRTEGQATAYGCPEANACTAAKDEVLKAQTDEAFDRAERKIRLLCVD